jgi:hypothetical protein
VSSRTWTPRAVASSAARARFSPWRAVEAQHVAATMALVDTLQEQLELERLLDESKPPVPAGAEHLHYLLFTPFRYAPPPGGSRFRAPTDPGVFHAADEIRTACAELGYWRWRHLLDTPSLNAMPSRPQTVLRVRVACSTIDLREPPFLRERRQWTSRSDHAACQALASVAREVGIGAIRYESVRDQQHGGCAALLTWQAFAEAAPVESQVWTLSVMRERVVWQRTDGMGAEAFEFPSAGFAYE